jgi:hypothetical protein
MIWLLEFWIRAPPPEISGRFQRTLAEEHERQPDQALQPLSARGRYRAP